MNSTAVQTSAFWNDPANDILKDNKEFVGAYVDTMLNRSVLNELFKIDDTNEINEKFSSFEANGTVDIVPEGQNISNFELGKGYEVIMSPYKFAKRIEMTYEALKSIQDPTRDADAVLAKSSMYILAAFKKAMESRCISYFDNAFSTAGSTALISYVAPDGQPLISATHTYNTGGGFDNTLTNWPLTTAIIDEVREKSSNTVGADGMPIDMNVRTLLVRKHSQAHRDALRIFGYSDGSNRNQYHVSTIGNINIYEGMEMKIIATPYLDKANNGKSYFFLADFDEAMLPNPLKIRFIDRPGTVGEFKDGDNLSVYRNFVSYQKDGIAYLPLGIYGVDGSAY